MDGISGRDVWILGAQLRFKGAGCTFQGCFWSPGSQLPGWQERWQDLTLPLKRPRLLPPPSQKPLPHPSAALTCRPRLSAGRPWNVSQPSPSPCQSSAGCRDSRSRGLLHPQWLRLWAPTFRFEVKPFPSYRKEKLGGSHTGCPEPLVCPARSAEPESHGDIPHWSVCAFCRTAKS